MKSRHSVLTVILLALGFFALFQVAQAVSPPPDGDYAGGNTAEGQAALFSLTTGTYNTAVGFLSLTNIITARFNTGIGAGTLLFNSGDNNTANGAGALLTNTTGFQNTATGAFALFSNTAGDSNAAVGVQSLFHNNTGVNNTAVGFGALFSNTTGVQNTANGYNALVSSTTGNNNTALGVNAGGGVTTASNVICIGAGGQNVDNSCYIGQIFGATSSGGTAVFIGSDGKLGTTTSSRRFKEEIKPMDKASEVLFALKPVTFRYQKEIDPERSSQFGLVAEEVEKVNPDLVVRDKEGKPYTVRYEQINVMLLNEFLKAHREMEKQQKQIDALTAQLKGQAALIQKVSVQVGLNRTAARMALNNP